ncbi:MAG: hypothetical protein RBU25_17355 [Lentisphaeria bacterium]|nr:hypothetical protein [Lentisphaeria bacterium]
MVHEDSKDAFFVAEKNRHNGFAILTIKYSEDFTHANVVTEIDTDFVMPGFAKQAVKIPMTTMWKLDEGEWWWYVLPPELGRDSPFGRLVPGAEDSSGGIAQRLGSMPSAEAIQNLVRVDKTDVILKSDEASSDEIQISNGMPGPVTLKLEAPKVEGLEIRVEPTQVPARGRAKIVFTYTPDEDKIRPQYVEGTLEIQPTNHFLPVRIAIAPPQGDPPPIPEAKP